MRIKVTRPKAQKKKIHCKNEFELCYLRHRYFRRVKYNPTEEEMKPFKAIVANLAKNTYFTYKNLFYLVGLESEDLVNIGNVHLVSFLGLFSLENMPEKYKEFVRIFKEAHNNKPDEEDILDKNQANFTMFLKQRMEDVVRVCRQKARNIKGLPAEECFYYCGPIPPPKILTDLIKNYEKLGFRKLDSAVYKTIRKRAGIVSSSIFLFDDKYYISVPLDKKFLNLEDFNGTDMNPYDSLHNMSPEDVYFTLEENKIWENRQKEFNNKPDSIKANIIRNFIQVNQGNIEYKEEVKVAKRILKELE